MGGGVALGRRYGPGLWMDSRTSPRAQLPSGPTDYKHGRRSMQQAAARPHGKELGGIKYTPLVPLTTGLQAAQGQGMLLGWPLSPEPGVGLSTHQTLHEGSLKDLNILF